MRSYRALGLSGRQSCYGAGFDRACSLKHKGFFMLRFDIPPVFSNVIRWEAFLVFCICLIALFVSPWVLLILPVQGFIKGFFGHHKCPSHLLWKTLFVKQGWQGHKENAGAKMFASKILFIAGSVASALFLMGSTRWQIPCTAVLIFSFMEWAFSFCAACYVYGAWYRFFPSKG